MVVLGIDVGVSGAIAATDARGSYQVDDLAVVAVAGDRLVKRRLDARGLLNQVRRFVPPGEKAMALIEDLHMRPGNGGAATASLLDSRGVVRAVLEIAGVQVVEVQPITWKGFYGLLAKDKRASLDVAKKLCPGLAHLLQRQLDHNRAESLLIAHYGQRKLT